MFLRFGVYSILLDREDAKIVFLLKTCITTIIIHRILSFILKLSWCLYLWTLQNFNYILTLNDLLVCTWETITMNLHLFYTKKTQKNYYLLARLLERRSKLTLLKNSVLIYKALIKPIVSYGLDHEGQPSIPTATNSKMLHSVLLTKWFISI